MTILTASNSILVGDAAIATASTTLSILPSIGLANGTGRLIHPTLGTYDYPYAPDRWVNVDGDILTPPVWGNQKALLGSVNTLFVGDIRDVVCEEYWDQEISAPIDFLRALIAFWMNPPDPSVAYVEWYPNYTNAYGYNVILESLTVGGHGIAFDWVSKQDWVTGTIALKLRICGRL